MKYSIRKNWVASFEMLINHPILLLPFIFIAFFETFALELIYFSNRFPLSAVIAPIIKKFFGEAYLHYPAHLAVVPQLFYYIQIAIFIFAGTLLSAIAVNMFNSINEKLPIKANAMVRNAVKRYGAFAGYGVIFIVLMALITKVDSYIFIKAFRLASRLIPRLPGALGTVGLQMSLFFANLILQAIFIASIPYMVLEKKRFFPAVFASFKLFIRNTGTIICLTALPFLLYLPIVAMKSVSGKLAEVIFPEIIVLVTFSGSMIAIFADSFILICVCKLIMDKSKVQGKAL